ncbi:MAG: hypothetical protein OYH77_05145 [Pseudomonadota bacterium]|nr:hypothetical protein [Pseudomonadota bacterium]
MNIQHRIEKGLANFANQHRDYSPSVMNEILILADSLISKINDGSPARLIDIKIEALTVYKSLVRRLLKENDIINKAIEKTGNITFTKQELVDSFADLAQLVILYAEANGWQESPEDEDG